MIHEIPKPKISQNFTIDDIHKIREWNYERLKDASSDEILSDIKERADSFKRLIDARKRINIKQ